MVDYVLVKHRLISDVILPAEHTGHLLQVVLREGLKERYCLKELDTLVLFGLHDAIVDA